MCTDFRFFKILGFKTFSKRMYCIDFETEQEKLRFGVVYIIMGTWIRALVTWCPLEREQCKRTGLCSYITENKIKGKFSPRRRAVWVWVRIEIFRGIGKLYLRIILYDWWLVVRNLDLSLYIYLYIGCKKVNYNIHTVNYRKTFLNGAQ